VLKLAHVDIICIARFQYNYYEMKEILIADIFSLHI